MRKWREDEEHKWIPEQLTFTAILSGGVVREGSFHRHRGSNPGGVWGG